MQEKIEPRTLKGFRDFTATEQRARQALFGRIQNTFELFGFSPLSTPALEYKEILMGKYGDEEKLVYSFVDNGGREVAMRYDLTVPLARYVAQNYGALTLPFKRYQIAPVWRAENTQKGRLREFYQCDVDIVGESSVFADAEVIACLSRALENIGVLNYVFRVNSRQLFGLLSEDEQEVLAAIRCVDKLDKVGLAGVQQLLVERNVSEGMQQILTSILSAPTGEAALEVYAQVSPRAAEVCAGVRLVIDSAIELGVPANKIVFDPSIARGLDYYSGTVFECALVGVEGYGSIAGGGRYDGLLSTYTTESVPAVGGALGVDRLYEYLEAAGLLVVPSGTQVVVAAVAGVPSSRVFALVQRLRTQGIAVEPYFSEAKLEKQYKYAEKKGIPYMIVPQEQTPKLLLRTLSTRTNVELHEDEVISLLTSTT